MDELLFFFLTEVSWERQREEKVNCLGLAKFEQSQPRQEVPNCQVPGSVMTKAEALPLCGVCGPERRGKTLHWLVCISKTF